jgi:hypothetical protein
MAEENNIITQPDETVYNAPSQEKLDRAKEVLNERLKASKRIVNAKKGKWKTWDRMYKNEQIANRIEGESNLVLPKADYIAETISAKVINAIFSVTEWMTMRHPTMDPDILYKQNKFFMWIMDRKVNFYLTAIEMFKSSPIKGTSICKTFMRNFWPYVEYLDLESFFPDPMARKPGDIQSMRFCMHQFKRDQNQIKKFTAPDGRPIYLNMEKLLELGKTLTGESLKMKGTDTAVEDKTLPIYDLVEYHGEFEYEKGKYGEYILTGVLREEVSDECEFIIRCEPSSFRVRDNYSGDIMYLKPFVSNIYAVNPGEFYGKSAISSVESLINEQTDLHNLYMDNHKRFVNGIIKVLNRSDLSRDDLRQVPGALWFMDSFDDVDMFDQKEVNLAGYKLIHDLLDREIEKGTSITGEVMGISQTKRQTFGEVQSMIKEASDRFQLFIQMADRITLRPVAQRVYAMLRQTFDIYSGGDFVIDGEEISINKENLLEDMDVQFAATTVETEHSKYSKQQTFPQLLQNLQLLAGGRLNVDEIISELGKMYNFTQPERFVYPEPMVPVSVIPPEVLPVIEENIAQQQQGAAPSGSPGPSPTPTPDQLPPGGAF